MGEDRRLKGLRRKGAAFYYDAGGTPRRWIALGSDEAVAMRRYKALVGQPAAAGSIDAMLAAHLATIERAAGTMELYRVFRRHLSGVFGHLRPDEITQADVLRYLDDCPRTSFRGEIALLSAAYRTAMRRREVTFNPCLGVKTDRPRARRTRLLLPGELDAILAKADPRLAVAVELAYATGLRISDICRLRWGDLERDHVRTTKTGARIAYEMTDDLRAILARAKALQARVAGLYVVSNRGAPFDKDSLGYLWTKACKAAGVGDARFHDVRAMAASAVDAQGGDAQRFLAHSDPKTTRGYLRGRAVTVVKPLRRSSTGGGS